MAEICSVGDRVVSDSIGAGVFDAGSTKSNHTSNTMSVYDNQPEESFRSHSKAAEILSLELADSTANFLEQLLLLIDRGYVLQRLRDLLTLLEIRHSMVGHLEPIPFDLSIYY